MAHGLTVPSSRLEIETNSNAAENAETLPANASGNPRDGGESSDTNSEGSRSRAESDTSLSSVGGIATESLNAQEPPRQYPCPLANEYSCLRIFDDIDKAQLYTSCHTPVLDFPCLFRVWTRTEYECTKVFYSAHAAYQHAKHAHKIYSRYLCPLGDRYNCTRIFKTQRGAELHSMAHNFRTTTRMFLKYLCPLVELYYPPSLPYGLPTSTEVILEHLSSLVELYYPPPPPYSYPTSTEVVLGHLGSLVELFWFHICPLAGTYSCYKAFYGVPAALRHAFRHCPGELGSICTRQFENLHSASQHARAKHAAHQQVKHQYAANPRYAANRITKAQDNTSQHAKAEHNAYQRGKVRHNSHQHAKARDNASQRAKADESWLRSTVAAKAHKNRIEGKRLREMRLNEDEED